MNYEKFSRKRRTKALLSKQSAANRNRFSKSDYMDDRWKVLRIRILDRDGWKCSACKAISNLHVHHTKYVSGGKIWDSPEKDLITLCKDCHKIVHKILAGRL